MQCGDAEVASSGLSLRSGHDRNGHHRAGRAPDADRRRARRRLRRRDVRQHQSGDRRGARRRRGRDHRRCDACRRCRAPRVRHDGLVDQPRPARALPRAAEGGAGGGARGAPPGDRRRGRLAGRPDLRGATGRTDQRVWLLDRPGEDVRVREGPGPDRFDRPSEPRRRGSRAHRRRRRDHPVQLPLDAHAEQDRSRSRCRLHGCAQGCSADAVVCVDPGAAHRREDRLPARRRQHPHVVAR